MRREVARGTGRALRPTPFGFAASNSGEATCDAGVQLGECRHAQCVVCVSTDLDHIDPGGMGGRSTRGGPLGRTRFGGR